MAKPAKQNIKPKKTQPQPESWWMNTSLVAGIIAGVAFLLYSNSLLNGFVLDDSLVITKNSFTTQGVSGLGDIFAHDSFQGYYGTSATEIKIIGGRYRPLSLAFFAFIYQIFGANAFAFHFWNVLTYAICCGSLYVVLRKTFQAVIGLPGAAVFAGIAALLFAVHPVHTEVVNNIKSNDEILCLLLSLASLHLAVRYWDTRRVSLALMSGVVFFLGCLAKENAVVFLGIIPLTIYFRQQFSKAKKQTFLPLVLSMGISFVLYFLIRYAVLGWSMGDAPLDLINNPFIKYTGEGWVHSTAHEKLAMVFWSLGKYVQLLFIPMALSTDYYPRFVDVITFFNPVALFSLVLYIAMAIFVLYKILKKQVNLFVYGIAFFLLALSIVSNLVFPIGTNLAERFLFTPSVGFCIAISGLLYPLVLNRSTQLSKIVLPIACIVLLFWSGRTFARNFDFKSNKILFLKDIQVSERSAKIQNAVGAILAEEALSLQDPVQKNELSQRALTHLNTAITIHPTYLEAFYMRGNVFFMQGKYEEAIRDFRQTLNLNENFKSAYPNYALALREGARSILERNGDVPTAVQYLEESLSLFPNEAETKNLLDRARNVKPPGQ